MIHIDYLEKGQKGGGYYYVTDIRFYYGATHKMTVKAHPVDMVTGDGEVKPNEFITDKLDAMHEQCKAQLEATQRLDAAV